MIRHRAGAEIQRLRDHGVRLTTRHPVQDFPFTFGQLGEHRLRLSRCRSEKEIENSLGDPRTEDGFTVRNADDCPTELVGIGAFENKPSGPFGL